jgi:hypothetical protein
LIPKAISVILQLMDTRPIFLGILTLAALFLAIPALTASGFEKEQVYFPARLPKSAGESAGLWAVSLELGYIDIEAKTGIVNLLAPGHPAPKLGEVYLIREPNRVQKIMELAGLTGKEEFVLLAGSGKQARAQVSGFAYFRPAGDTVWTLGLLTPLAGQGLDNEDWALALKNITDDKKQKQNIIKIEDAPAEVCADLQERCVASWPGEKITESFCKKMDPGIAAKTLLITGFWHRPTAEFDIEDLQTDSCAREQGGLEGVLSVPGGIFPELAFAASRRGDFYLLGRGGSGAEVCRVLLEYSSDRFSLVRQGLCVGY